MDRVQRRDFLIAAGVLLAAPLLAEAQQTGKLRQIGYLAFNTAVIGRDLLNAFRQTMGELGWIDGQNIIIETRFADGDVNRLPTLVDELLLLKVDVIVAGSPRLRPEEDTQGVDWVRIAIAGLLLSAVSMLECCAAFL